MARWQDVEDTEPEFAGRVRARLDEQKHKLLATLRKDGAPRISGIETTFADGDLWLGMMPDSRKAIDLQRDGRCALHAATADKEVSAGDAKIAGHAVEVTDPQQRAAFERGFAETTDVDVNQLGDYHLFRLDVTEAVHLSLAPERDAMLIERWAPGQPVTTIRRA